MGTVVERAGEFAHFWETVAVMTKELVALPVGLDGSGAVDDEE